MLTVLEILIILAMIPVLVWPLLPVKHVPRFLDFMPLASALFLMLHLFIDHEPVILRFIPLYIFIIVMFLVTIVKIFKHNPNQPKKRVLAGVGSVVGLFALAICVWIPIQVLPFNHLPEPTGKFNVGTVICDLIDKNRVETYADEKGKPRKIAVQFWYPTDRLEDAVQYDIDNAPVTTSRQSYPVLIFSHGAFGVRMSNASTFRELASHGYIVASIDHTYQAFYTSFADGKGIPVSTAFLNDAMKVQSNSLPLKESYEITHDWLELRTADIELVIESLKSGDLGKAGELLKGHMDLSKIGLFGHSLGGAAAAQICRERDDVAAAIVMDGTMIGDITEVGNNNKEIVTEEVFTKPLMLMYASLFQDPDAKATSYMPNIKAFENSANAAYSVCIKDSGHLNFTDLPRISPFLAKQLGVGTIDSYRCIKIVNDYSLAFFDKHIKGQNSSLLEDPFSYQEVEFAKQK